MNFPLELLCIGSITALIHIKKAIAYRAVPFFSSRRYKSIGSCSGRYTPERKKASVRLGELQRNSGHGGLCGTEPRVYSARYKF